MLDLIMVLMVVMMLSIFTYDVKMILNYIKSLEY